MKYENLEIMKQHGLPVPPFSVVTGLDQVDLSFSSATRFAVRSTFEGEDSAEYSFAGQFDSYLNVTRDEVPQAVRKVQESYRNRAADYTAAHQVSTGSHHDAPVIIQEMIQAEYSGVLFTSNPVGILNEMVIVVGRGLGDRVVEDRTDVTTYYYNCDDDLYYHEASGNSPELSETLLAKLIEYGKEVSQLFDTPTDIEYAVCDGIVWLLQARPITTFSGKPPIVLDNSNIVESYPNITLPLSQTFVKDVYYRIFQSLLNEVTDWDPIVEDMDPELKDMVDAANGRMYYRISNWYGVLNLLPFSKRFIRMWQQMLGVNNKTVVTSGRKVPVSVKFKLTAALIRCLRKTPKRMEELNRFYINYSRDISHELSMLTKEHGPDKIRKLLDCYEGIKTKILSRWHVTLINDMYAFIYTYLSGKRNQERLADIRNLASMKPVVMLNRLADIYAEEGDSSRYQKEKETFIDLYGDRYLNELKLESRTYRTNPELVEEYFRHHSRHSDSTQKDKSSPSRFYLRRRWVQRAKVGIRNREISRMNRTRLFGIARTIFRAIGEELQTNGMLDSLEDVFYLTIPELEQYADGADGSGFRDLVLQRKELYRMYRSLPSYSRLIFDGVIVDKHVVNASYHVLNQQHVLTGIASSVGKVRGEALVIEEPDLSIDTRDKILITRMTDPGWVFLIENSKGIIAEKGSMLSHTAIITRELHKPSIVNVKDATRLIRTGDMLELDAFTGTVSILNGESA